MSIAYKTLVTKLSNHAKSLGVFATVNHHEPKDAPTGPHCAFYVAGIRPAPLQSGLNVSSALVVIMGRIYSNMIQEPEDDIDPSVVAATDALMAAYTGDFTLGGNVMMVDLLGSNGEPLSARAGYINVSGTMFRSMDITIPLVVADAWTQGA